MDPLNNIPHPEPPQPAATPRRYRWRRLVQYRLRTLLILTAVLAALFAVTGAELVRLRASYQREQEIAHKITARGGIVVYDLNAMDFKASRSWAERLKLTRLLKGDHHFRRVTMVGLSNTQVSSSELVEMGLEDLPELTALSLDECKNVDDAAAPCLRNLSELRSLDLGYTRIGDKTIEAISGLEHLQKLSLRGTLVTPESVPLLKRFAQLEFVAISGPNFGDPQSIVFRESKSE